MVDGAEALAVEAAALEANFVEAVGVDFSRGRSQGEREHILGDGGAAADVGMAADAAKLVHRAKGSDGRVVLDDDVTGEGSGVGEDTVIADDAIVADVGVGHDEAMTSDAGGAAAARGSARDGHAFADGVVVSHANGGGLALVFEILGRDADAGKRKEAVAGAGVQMAVENDVRDQLALFAENDIRSDGAVRADRAGCGDDRTGSDDGGGVNAHTAVPDSGAGSGGAPPAAGLRRGTSWHMTMASQASLPSTVTLPSIRTARGLQLRTVISIRI